MMLSLQCYETGDNEVNACVDQVLLRDPRVLKNMLKTEEISTPINYSKIDEIQTQIEAHMVATVSNWMSEVCDEQQRQVEVFPLAMNYLFRYLATTDVPKNHLQAVGATCMLLASKLREPRPLTTEDLMYYTDYSVSRKTLLRYELVILQKLRHELAAVVAVDFIPHLLLRLDLESVGIPEEMVRNHAKVLITECAKECQFSGCHPSLLACACIASALCGLGWVNKYHQSLEDLLDKFQEMTSVDTEFVKEVMSRIDRMIQAVSAQQDSTSDNTNNNTCSSENEQVTRPEEFTPPPSGKVFDHKTATTPTDVQDIHF